MDELQTPDVEPVISAEVASPKKRFLTISKMSLILSLLSLTMIGAGTYYGWGPVTQYRNTDPQIDGYVQPRSIAKLVDLVQSSTVTIYCEANSEEKSGLGTGWALDISTVEEGKYPTALITNHHVIENCTGGKGKVYVEEFGGEKHAAIIANWDVENDLAVVATKLEVRALELSYNIPYPGYWVMAVGTADGYAGSVAFGNVLNITGNEILITAALSHGNSGGPLVDNEGYVIGINSWGSTVEQYNGAMSLDALCYVIKMCTDGTFWDWSS